MKLEDIKAIFENYDMFEEGVPEINKILKEAKIRLQNNRTTAIIFEHPDSKLFKTFSKMDGPSNTGSHQIYSTSTKETQLPRNYWPQLDKTDFIVIQGYMLGNAEKLLKEFFPDVVIVVVKQLKDIDSRQVRDLLHYCSNNTLLSSIYVVLNDAPDLECVEMDQCMLCYPIPRKKFLGEILPPASMTKRVFKVSTTKRIDFQNGARDAEYLESLLNDEFEKLNKQIRNDLDQQFREHRCVDAIVESEKLLIILQKVKENEEVFKKNIQKCSIAMEENVDFCMKKVKKKTSDVLHKDFLKIDMEENEEDWKRELKVTVENNITNIGFDLAKEVKERLGEIPNLDYALKLFLKDGVKPAELTEQCLQDSCYSQKYQKIQKDDLWTKVETSFLKILEKIKNAFKTFLLKLNTLVEEKVTKIKVSLDRMYRGTSEDFANGIVKPLQTREIIKNNVLINSKEQDLYKFIDDWTGVNILFIERYDAHLEVNPDMLLTKNDLESLKSDILKHIDVQFQGIGSDAFRQLKEKLRNIIISKETLIKGDLAIIGTKIKKQKYYIRKNRMSLVNSTVQQDQHNPDRRSSAFGQTSKAKHVETQHNPDRRSSAFGLTSKAKQVETQMLKRKYVAQITPLKPQSNKISNLFINEIKMYQMVSKSFERLIILPQIIDDLNRCVETFFETMQN